MDHFPRGSVIRRVNIEPAVLLGAGRALVMQLSHPAVARGVDEHSNFARNPFTRLLGTLEATYAAVYGSRDLARDVGLRIQRVHDFVTGPSYAANDPANLLWVHATLCDTALDAYERLVGPLSPDDAETYYQEMTAVAALFGLPRDEQPATLAEFRAYVAQQVADLQVVPIGAELARFVLDPTLPLHLDVPLRPALRWQRRYALGTLPPAIRSQLDIPWSDGDQRRFERTERRLRAACRRTPTALRTLPTRAIGPVLLALARRHVGDGHARR